MFLGVFLLATLAGGTYALAAVVLVDEGEPNSGSRPGGESPVFQASGQASSGQPFAPVIRSLAAVASPDEATATPTPTPTTTMPTPTASPTEAPAEIVEVAPAEAIPTETPPTNTPEPPTETPVPPTETPVPPTPTPELPTPTPTPEPPTPTPTLAIPANIPLLGDFVPTPTATTTPIATESARSGPNVDDGTDGLVAGSVTRYADSLEGNTMACGGAFDQDNPFIVAVSLAYDTVWPCGTTLEICGGAGCLTGVRTDTCPGCAGAEIDMTRAGVDILCGNQGGCGVVIRRLD